MLLMRMVELSRRYFDHFASEFWKEIISDVRRNNIFTPATADEEKQRFCLHHNDDVDGKRKTLKPATMKITRNCYDVLGMLDKCPEKSHENSSLPLSCEIFIMGCLFSACHGSWLNKQCRFLFMSSNQTNKPNLNINQFPSQFIWQRYKMMDMCCAIVQIAF